MLPFKFRSFYDTDRSYGFAFEGQAWQYRVLRFGLSLSPRVFTKVVEGTLTPLWQVGIRVLNSLDDWLILAQSREQLGDHRDLVLRHLSQLGLWVNWKNSKLSPVQRISFLCVESVCSVEYDGTPHVGTCPSSAELPEFLQRQECGTTETVSEAPGAYGICSCSLAARIASYEYTPGSRSGHGATIHCEWVSPSSVAAPSAPGQTLPFYGRGVLLEQVSWHIVVTTDASSTGWSATCKGAGSLGTLDRAPTALAHQLPRAVGSAFSLTAVPATAVGQARASPHGQHCGCLVHQPAGRYTITPHVTALPPSPPLESHAVQVTAHCSHPREAFL